MTVRMASNMPQIERIAMVLALSLRTPEQGALEFEEVVVPLTEASETHLCGLQC